jgi:hypothetical protein
MCVTMMIEKYVVEYYFMWIFTLGLCGLLLIVVET